MFELLVMRARPLSVPALLFEWSGVARVFRSSKNAIFFETLHEGAMPTSRPSFALLHGVPCNASASPRSVWTCVGRGGDVGGLGLESFFSTTGCGGDSEAWI